MRQLRPPEYVGVRIGEGGFVSNRRVLAVLQVGSVGVIGLGLMAAFAAHPATAEPWRLLSDAVQWPVDGHPAGFSEPTRQVITVLGGVLVGWGATLLWLARGPLGGPDGPSVARAALIGLVAWFVVDSAGSWVSNLPGNIVLNVLSFAILAPPLWMLRRRGSGQE